MRIFIQSCHASLEFDHAKMFLGIGCHVFGEFDIGSQQRPKIVGVTDVNSNRDEFDLIILHQVPDYCGVMRKLLDAGKRVALVSFGQADIWQYEAVGEICRMYQHAYVVPYSLKDERMHLAYGAPSAKVKMIRFGKFLDDYEPWVGGGGYIYASCNSIQRRGNGCGWTHMERCLKELPLVLSGKETNEVGGIGEITEEKMCEKMRHADGFLSLGTAPAALVLTQIEAWCAGCPTAILDNGHGITSECLHGIIAPTANDLISECNKLLSDEHYKQSRHRDSVSNSRHFDVTIIGPQWKALLEEMTA